MENGGSIWFQIEKGEHEEGHDFKFIVLKGHKDIFRFSFIPRTITEWNKLPKEIVTSPFLSIFQSKLF